MAGWNPGNGTERPSQAKIMAEINVTPMVDVMLVLLVIFMVTAPLLVAGVPVQLPKNSAQRISQPNKPVIVTLAADEHGQYLSRSFSWQQIEPAHGAWNALPEAERQAKTKEGIAAWKAWIEKHRDAIVEMGGPLGKTKKITGDGIEDVSNDMGAFMVVRAASQEEAARLFEHHPHFTIFPGQSVEVMPVLPIPEG